MAPRPHTSSALQALRGWVTACAAVVIIAAAVQLVVFGVVRYTEVRFAKLEAAAAAPAVVVKSGASASVPLSEGERRPEPARAATGAAAPRGTDPNRVLSVHDRNLALVANTTTAFGVIAAVTLAALTMLGVVVAGGAAVPGVERTVRAAVWALVVALLATPWSGLTDQAMARDLPPGVFAGYTTLLLGVDRAASDPMVALVEFIVIPTLVMVLGGCVALWFHSGVEQGVIVTSVNQVDHAIEREAAAIAKSGVSSLHRPRTLATLDRPLGDEPGPLRMTGTDPPRRPI